MLQTLIVQIECDLGQVYLVAERIIDSLEQAGEVYSTSGEYDLLCLFRLPRELDPGRFVDEKVRAIAGVRRTFTTIGFNAFTR